MTEPIPTLGEACRLAPVASDALRADTRRIIVVGAGGWIGRVLLRGIYDALGSDAFNDRVLGFGSTAREIDLGDGITLGQRPLDMLGNLPPYPSIVFHLAFLTKDKVGEMAQADYIAANTALSQTVYDALTRIGADRLFIASSGAARHADDPHAAEDLRLYGSLKRADEELFSGWACQNAQRKLVVMRIFNVSGPFINKHDTYALASFIRDAVAGRPIIVKAPMKVMRAYTALREVNSVVLAALLSADTPNIIALDSGGDEMELADVAAAVAQVLGGQVSRNPVTNNAANRYIGDASDYVALSGKLGIEAVPLYRQIAETAVSFIPSKIQGAQ